MHIGSFFVDPAYLIPIVAVLAIAFFAITFGISSNTNLPDKIPILDDIDLYGEKKKKKKDVKAKPSKPKPKAVVTPMKREVIPPEPKKKKQPAEPKKDVDSLKPTKEEIKELEASDWITVADRKADKKANGNGLVKQTKDAVTTTSPKGSPRVTNKKEHRNEKVPASDKDIVEDRVVATSEPKGRETPVLKIEDMLKMVAKDGSLRMDWAAEDPEPFEEVKEVKKKTQKKIDEFKARKESTGDAPKVVPPQKGNVTAKVTEKIRSDYDGKQKGPKAAPAAPAVVSPAPVASPAPATVAAPKKEAVAKKDVPQKKEGVKKDVQPKTAGNKEGAPRKEGQPKGQNKKGDVATGATTGGASAVAAPKKESQPKKEVVPPRQELAPPATPQPKSVSSSTDITDATESEEGEFKVVTKKRSKARRE